MVLRAHSDGVRARTEVESAGAGVPPQEAREPGVMALGASASVTAAPASLVACSSAISPSERGDRSGSSAASLAPAPVAIGAMLSVRAGTARMAAPPDAAKTPDPEWMRGFQRVCRPLRLDALRFERVLDEHTQSRARGGNKVDVLFDGVQSFSARERAIRAARSTIHLQTFIFNDDETGWRLARLLAERAQVGLKVRVLFDGLGSDRSSREIFAFLRDAGVEVREYANPSQFWKLNTRWHEKYLIVDSAVAIAGGMNVADEYAFGGSARRVRRRGGGVPWRDVDVRIEGPSVGDTQRAFLKNWRQVGEDVGEAEETELLRPRPTVGGTKVRVVQHRPVQDGDDNTHDLYYYSIAAAEHSITIENAYFVPPPHIREGLIEAAQRGVKVRVLTNSQRSNDVALISDVSRYYYEELLAGGVELYEREGGTLHAKSASFDGVFAIVGSMNLNHRGRHFDSECAVAIHDQETAQRLERRFAQGLGASMRISPAELAKASGWTRVKQWALSRMSKFF